MRPVVRVTPLGALRLRDSVWQTALFPASLPPLARRQFRAGSQSTVNYTFDADNRITALSSGPLSASVAYDQDSRRTSLTQPNGLTVTYGFDAASNLTSLIDKVNGNTIGYAYYTYDANGRRVGGSGNLGLADINLPAAASATYAANNTLSTWNGTAAATDGANNLTGDPTNDFAYFFDERNHLAQVNHLSITQYWMIYDGFGRREQLGNNVGSLSWTNYLYDGITPVQEQSSSGSKVDSLTMPGSGEVLARTDASGTVAPIYDGTGSTVWLVNSAGAIATQYMYEAYGKPTAALTASSNPFQFTGREHDPSGLYFMRNRYYSPTLSRFVSSDPIAFDGGDANLFRYAGGDPVNSSDPLGTVISGGVGVGIACCTFGGPSDFALDGISFDFSQLGVALVGQGLTLAINSGAGLTVGWGTASRGQSGLPGSFGGLPGGTVQVNWVNPRIDPDVENNLRNMPRFPELKRYPPGEPGYQAAPPPAPPQPPCPGGDLGATSDLDLVQGAMIGGAAFGTYFGGFYGGIAGAAAGLVIGNADLIGRAKCR